MFRPHPELPNERTTFPAREAPPAHGLHGKGPAGSPAFGRSMEPPGGGLTSEVQAIEAFFRRRYGREALYLPSGRLGLYLACREWLRPGDRVLMSPVTDDVVFFTVLAAGLVPVFGPIDPRTGNLDPAAIDDATWDRLQAVMTTNLYGVPDRMDLLETQCRRHGLLLLEDACHAFDARFGGRRIGEFGAAAVYSLSKYMGIAGGVLTFSEAGRRESLARRVPGELRRQLVSLATAYRWGGLVRTVGAPIRAPRWLAGVRDRLLPGPWRRSDHRMSYTIPDVADAQEQGGGLDPFDGWVRMDHPAYRTWPFRSSIRTSLRRLEGFEEDRRLRIDGARKLLELGYTPPGVRLPLDTALLRVPLFVQDREKVITQLAKRGLTTEYIYDPPLDLYAPGLAEWLPSPPSGRMWSRDVLPVNPLFADRFVGLLRRAPGICKPSQEVTRFEPGGSDSSGG